MLKLDHLIYCLINSVGGTYTIEHGIVTVTMKDGSTWDFTQPRKYQP